MKVTLGVCKYLWIILRIILYTFFFPFIIQNAGLLMKIVIIGVKGNFKNDLIICLISKNIYFFYKFITNELRINAHSQTTIWSQLIEDILIIRCIEIANKMLNSKKFAGKGHCLWLEKW